ncbi:MAG: SufD family Fe-S cluster assembly protein [Lachnospiraceae bacterium]|nr:SufD family Fe-S cluster assembly protein [Lachnospiraceae bacterium]
MARKDINKTSLDMLREITDWEGLFDGAYSIRQDGTCADMHSTETIRIVPKTDNPGIDIYIQAGKKKEKVYIPACVTKSGVDDVVYNDFHVQKDADVIIVAGCGVHTTDDEGARHNGIHRFFIEPGAHVLYKEKHIGNGIGSGMRVIDPVTDVVLGEDAVLEMDTQQLSGVNKTIRKTNAKLDKRAKLIIHESILTDDDNVAETDFEVVMEGEDSSVDLISRSVAKGESKQTYHSHIIGNCRCTGHSECDAILVGNGRVDASPALYAGHLDAALIHEAAIGRIAGEQIIKLQTLGLTEEEAEEKIIEGFLTGVE